jgi:hypothetical protein
VVIGAQRMNLHMVFLHMVNMGVQVEICARKGFWRVNNSGKPTNFRDIL